MNKSGVETGENEFRFYLLSYFRCSLQIMAWLLEPIIFFSGSGLLPPVWSICREKSKADSRTRVTPGLTARDKLAMTYRDNGQAGASMGYNQVHPNNAQRTREVEE